MVSCTVMAAAVRRTCSLSTVLSQFRVFPHKTRVSFKGKKQCNGLVLFSLLINCTGTDPNRQLDTATDSGLPHTLPRGEYFSFFFWGGGCFCFFCFRLMQ